MDIELNCNGKINITIKNEVKMKNVKEEQMQQPLPYTQEELDEYVEELVRWDEPPAELMYIVAKWVTEKFVSSQLGRSETFVCGHPPKRTYLLKKTKQK